jgi:hypothetical protein
MLQVDTTPLHVHIVKHAHTSQSCRDDTTLNKHYSLDPIDPLKHGINRTAIILDLSEDRPPRIPLK